MNDFYIVTATGIKDGKPYSSLSKVIQGKKPNGDTFCFIDSKTTIRENENMPFGEIVEYQTSRLPNKAWTINSISGEKNSPLMVNINN